MEKDSPSQEQHKIAQQKQVQITHHTDGHNASVKHWVTRQTLLKSVSRATSEPRGARAMGQAEKESVLIQEMQTAQKISKQDGTHSTSIMIPILTLKIESEQL